MDRQQALVLDFDGVIADSCRETFEVALATYRELAPATALARVAHEALYRRFMALMPFGNRAEDFGVVLAALEAESSAADGPTVEDQEAYWAFARQQSVAWLAEFHARFYANRRKLREENLATWLSWNPPYPKFIAVLPRLAVHWKLAIATAKDRTSVELLLREYGVAAFFVPELIFDKETGVSKAAHLRAIQAQLEIPFERITFIDDKVSHLDAVAELRLQGVLAAWGYNAAPEQERARARGYRVLELDQIEAELLAPSALAVECSREAARETRKSS